MSITPTVPTSTVVDRKAAVLRYGVFLLHPVDALLQSSLMPGDYMLTTDELDQLDDLSGPALYSAEVQRIPYLTPVERDDYIAAARNGDIAARNELITDCLRYVLHKANVTYQERRPVHSDLMDVVGHAHVTLLEAFPKALEREKPIKYLISMAAMEMRLYCLYDDPMIRRDRKRPFSADHPRTVGIEAVPEPVASERDEQMPDTEYKLVHKAVQELTEQRRAIVTAVYGLFGESVASEEDMAAMLHVKKNTIASYLYRARRSLARKLGPYVMEKWLHT